ncbi:MAG: tRNA dihydrouridine synthase DusB [Clostridia bacterium]|nr:tRNA dihydrouridine synthase DusB [Clostridia bacterium]
MITFGGVTLKHGLFLAPLAGYTDYAMRTVCREWGAEYTVTEMVSAKAICYGDEKTPELAALRPEELPAAVQLFGKEPEFIARAAELLASGALGGAIPSAIDINMGCPVPKIVSNGEGSALLRDTRLIYDIVSAVKKAVSLPVTVKIRIGWDSNSKTGAEAAKAAEAGGCNLIAVHGRTRAQLYSGEADLGEIAKIKRAVNIPVVGNGDIKSVADARKMLDETGADGIMIGRGAVGNPFLFRDLANAFDRGFSSECREAEIPLPDRISTALRQLSLAMENKGEAIAVTESRKSIAEYFKGLPGAARLRNDIHRASSFAEIERLLKTADFSR